jgi:EpsI family protein
MVSLVAVAVPFAYFTNKKPLGKAILIFSSFLISILANGARIALIGLWTYSIDGSQVHGPSDFFLVSFNFLIGVLLLFIISNLIDKFSDRFSKINTVKNLPHRETNSKPSTKNLFHFYGAGAICLSIFWSSYIITYSYPILPKEPSISLNNLPYTIGNWIGKDYDNFINPLNVVTAPYEISRRYTDLNGNAVDLYIAYFKIQDDNDEIFHPLYNSIVSLASHTNKISLDFSNDDSIETNEFIYEKPNNNRFGWSWYYLNDSIVAGQYHAKMLSIKNIFFNRNNNGAIIIVMSDLGASQNTGNSDEILRSFSLDFIPLIKKYLGV